MTVIRRISQVSNPKQPCVKLTMTGNRLEVSADNPYVGDACEEMAMEKEGDDIRVTVNVRYLTDALRAIDTQETLIGINGDVTPIVIRPSRNSNDSAIFEIHYDSTMIVAHATNGGLLLLNIRL